MRSDYMIRAIKMVTSLEVEVEVEIVIEWK